LPYEPRRTRGGNYYAVKAAMEAAVLEETSKGVPTVLVNPTGLVGEGSRNPALSAVCVFYQGLSPFMVDATMNFVDTSDVAKGHVLALQKGKPGERYILSGWNTTLREMAEKICKLAGKSRPMILPRKLMWLGAVFAEYWGLISGGPGAVSLSSYYHLVYGQHYSCEKAKKELGYEPAADLEPAILRELAWHGVKR
jgi:dihydroflavonol-4-reductase